MKACVYSVYMANISEEMRDYQARCVKQFLPADWSFTQVYEDYNHTPPYRHDNRHSDLLARLVRDCPTDVVCFLDIDAIPVSAYAFDFLYDFAVQGVLVGPPQRSLHLQNNRHIFIAMSATAFSKKQYAAVGSPSFATTYRGDIGEELTYAWDEKGGRRIRINPTDVKVPLWPYEVDGEKVYGHGTTFGGLFYHEFESSGYTGKAEEHKTRFLEKCREVLGEKC